MVQVRALLGSATPSALRVPAAPEAGDPELAAAQQARLMAIGTRTMALPLGRGALTLGAQYIIAEKSRMQAWVRRP